MTAAHVTHDGTLLVLRGGRVAFDELVRTWEGPLHDCLRAAWAAPPRRLWGDRSG